MRIFASILLVLAFSNQVLASEKCFTLSFEEGKPTTPPERLCISAPNAPSDDTQVRLLWGQKEVAVFKFKELGLRGGLPENKTSRTLAPSGYFTPALSAFAINMSGTIDPVTHKEKGIVRIGNQVMAQQKLHYISE
jgi:hypothetical protein